MLRDTAKFEVGTVSTQMIKNKKYFTVVTKLHMKNAGSPWVHTTIATVETPDSVYHSSYNKQRDRAVNFGKIATGYYHDKIKQQHTIGFLSREAIVMELIE